MAAKAIEKKLHPLSETPRSPSEAKDMFKMSALNRKCGSVLAQDTNFLISHGFLDYSLLFAVEKSDAKRIDS